MKKFVSVMLILTLVVTSNIPFLSGADIKIDEELIRPNDLYAVDYFAELSENISKADIVVLGDYEFSTSITYDNVSNEQKVIGKKNLLINKNKVKKSICGDSISKKKSDDEMKMIFVASDAITDQYREDNAEILRTALENGYIIFFECADAQTINRINRDIFEIYDDSFTDNEDKTENEEIVDGKKSFFFISKSKDDFIYYHIVDTYYNGNKELFDCSILEHAWSNRNNINYIEDVESYKSALKEEAPKNSSIMSVSAAGLCDQEVHGVTFHGNWLRVQKEWILTTEWNFDSHLKHRMNSASTVLMSEQLSEGKRIWANVTSIEVTPNNTNTTDRPFYNLNAWFWSEIKKSDGTVKSYAPGNAPKNTTYTYGWDIGAEGPISGSIGDITVSVGASFSQTTTSSDVEYYTNKYDEIDGMNGTTFNMAFNGNSNYAKNHSTHTTVTFFETRKSIHTLEFHNKQMYEIGYTGLGDVKLADQSNAWPYQVTYNSNFSNFYLK